MTTKERHARAIAFRSLYRLNGEMKKRLRAGKRKKKKEKERKKKRTVDT